MSKKYNVAVIGATGNIGRETINILDEREFPVGDVYAVASQKSLGREVSFGEQKIVAVVALNTLDYSKIDIVFGAAGSKISKAFAAGAVAKGAIVIDQTPCFGMDKDVPLVVPEVNGHEIAKFKNSGIISTPGPIAVSVVMALKPLDNAVKIVRIVMSTYQSASGAGVKAMDELYDSTKGKYMYKELPNDALEKNIAFNLIPKVGDFDASGYTDDEIGTTKEVQKIMGRKIPISATSVRVPVFIGHAISINVEFSGKMSANEAREILSEAESISVDEAMCYTTPIESVGADEVFVSRIRDDNSKPNTINMWIVCDNLRKGAALNAVQVAELLIKHINKK